MHRISVIVLTFLLGAQSQAGAKVTIPNVSLQVTVQQKENGTLSSGYHILHLVCWQGSCSLTSNTLNQCMKAGSGNEAFFPKVERVSTDEGNLVVTPISDTELDVRERDPEAELVFRFGFEEAPKSLMATKTTSFSGGFVKNSVILHKILTVEYVPLKQDFTEVKMDCAAVLPGLSQLGK